LTMIRVILREAEKQRQEAYDNYQMNLTNFRLAIQEIDENYADDPDMREFRKTLEGHVRDTVRERKKEAIMLAVIKQQLAELEAL